MSDNPPLKQSGVPLTNKMEIAISLIGALAGVLGGFFYWKKVGCLGGSCSTFMGKYSSMIYGGLIGVMLGGIVIETLG